MNSGMGQGYRPAPPRPESAPAAAGRRRARAVGSATAAAAPASSRCSGGAPSRRGPRAAVATARHGARRLGTWPSPGAREADLAQASTRPRLEDVAGRSPGRRAPAPADRPGEPGPRLRPRSAARPIPTRANAVVPNVRSCPTASASISTPLRGRAVVAPPRRDALLAVHGDGVPPAQRHRDVGRERPEGDARRRSSVSVSSHCPGWPWHLAARRVRDAERRHRRPGAGGAHGGVGREPAPDRHVGLVHGASSPGPARRGRCAQPRRTAPTADNDDRDPVDDGHPRRPCGRRGRPSARPDGRRSDVGGAAAAPARVAACRSSTRSTGCTISASATPSIEARSRASMTRPRRRAPTRASQRDDERQQQPAEQPDHEQHQRHRHDAQGRRVADHLVELGPADDDVERQPEEPDDGGQRPARAAPARRPATRSAPGPAARCRRPRGRGRRPARGRAGRRRAPRHPPTGAAARRWPGRRAAGWRGRPRRARPGSAAAATSGRAPSARRRR